MSSEAFALIELLVVTAIVAILAGLLLRALSRAQKITQELQCLINLRHLGVALLLYMSDTGSLMCYQGPGPLNTPTDHWTEHLFNDYGRARKVRVCPVAPDENPWSQRSHAREDFGTAVQAWNWYWSPAGPDYQGSDAIARPKA